MKDLVIIGAGEFGREVQVWSSQAIEAGAGFRLKGFLDGRSDALAGFDVGIGVVGTVDEYQPRPNDVFICAIGTPRVKRRVFESLGARGGQFMTLRHPTALVGSRVTIGDGCILAPYTQMSCDIRVGRLVTFGTFSNAGHDTRIGDFVQISGSCELNGRVTIADDAFLGSHATILPRGTVGAGAYVGAGSVVLRRVRPRTKVFGNPAVQVGTVDDDAS
jgi:sugar O-acyltransferase (sialic acid O-acetyltransferase NeuD family)